MWEVKFVLDMIVLFFKKLVWVFLHSCVCGGAWGGGEVCGEQENVSLASFLRTLSTIPLSVCAGKSGAKSKSGAVVKHQRMLVVYETTSKVKWHF